MLLRARVMLLHTRVMLLRARVMLFTLLRTLCMPLRIDLLPP
jgi:hypothetical protein